MYSQAFVRTRRSVHRLRRVWPPVTVGTEKVLAGSGWTCQRAETAVNMLDGWKGGRPGVRLKCGDG